MNARFNIIKKAKEMGVDPGYAIRCRSRYLCEEIDRILSAAITGGELEEAIAMQSVGEILQEMGGLIPMAASIGEEERITDEMVERARAYPVPKLIEFVRGKALAVCHDDTRPSLTYMSRINKAWCPVCDKYFDSIAILMQRDGYSFREAVRRLQ